MIPAAAEQPANAAQVAAAAGLTVQIDEGIAAIDPALWAALGSDRPFSSARWQRFAEAVLHESRPFYLTILQHGMPVARATCWLRRDENLPVPPGRVRGLLEAGIARWPLLVCRAPLNSLAGLVLPAAGPLRDRALALLADTAQQIGRQHRASFVFFDYLEPDDCALPGWPGAYARFEIPDPGTALAIEWPDFETYLSTRRKSVKKDFRRHRNRAADLGIEIRVAPAITTPLAEAVRLIRNVEDQHGSAHNQLVRPVLENAALADCAWLTATIDDRLVGCGLLLGDEGAWVLSLLGMEYDVQYVYFQLVYAAIRHVIEAGGHTLRGGGGAYDIKERLGFVREAQNYVMATATNPLFRWAMQRFAP